MRLFKKERNPFKADVILDKDEIMIVGAQLGKKPIFLGVGTAREQAKEIEGKIGLKEAAGAHKVTRELDWRLFYKPENLPGWFPIEHLTPLATNATTAISGSINALKAKMIPISGEKEFSITPDISISGEGLEIKRKELRKKYAAYFAKSRK